MALLLASKLAHGSQQDDISAGGQRVNHLDQDIRSTRLLAVANSWTTSATAHYSLYELRYSTTRCILPTAQKTVFTYNTKPTTST